MAANLFSGKSVGLYLLVAVVLAATAFLQAFQSSFVGTFSVLLFIGAGIAAVTEFVNVYGASGNTPGPGVPVKTIASFVLTALLYAGTWFIGQHTVSTYTAIAGSLLFLGYLDQELTGAASPTPVPAPPATPPAS